MKIELKIEKYFLKQDFSILNNFILKSYNKFLIDFGNEKPYVFGFQIDDTFGWIRLVGNTNEKILSKKSKWESGSWNYEYNLFDDYKKELKFITKIFNYINNLEIEYEKQQIYLLHFKIKLGECLNIIRKSCNKYEIVIGTFNYPNFALDDVIVINFLNQEIANNTYKVEMAKRLGFLKNKINNEERQDFTEIFNKISKSVFLKIKESGIKNLLKIGINKAFKYLSKEIKNEKIYIFGIFTTNEFNSFSIIANTKESLSSRVEQLKKENSNISKKEINYEKWAFGEWKYSFRFDNNELSETGDKFFDIYNYFSQEVYENEEIDDLDSFYDEYGNGYLHQLYYDVENHIADLVKFATSGIRKKNNDILVYFRNGDPDKKRLMELIKITNDNLTLIDTFKKEYY